MGAAGCGRFAATQRARRRWVRVMLVWAVVVLVGAVGWAVSQLCRDGGCHWRVVDHILRLVTAQVSRPNSTHSADKATVR